MKKDDKELEEYIQREKNYLEHQRSLRQQINGGKLVNNNQTSLENNRQFLKTIYQPASLAQQSSHQQQYLKKFQDGVKHSQDKNVKSSQIIHTLNSKQVSPTHISTDSNIKSLINLQILPFSSSTDCQNGSTKHYLKSISNSQTDLQQLQTRDNFQQNNVNQIKSSIDEAFQDKMFIDKSAPNLEFLSRNCSLTIPKSSQSSNSKQINEDNQNIFQQSAFNFQTKRSSLPNNIYLTPLQSRAHTPQSIQTINYLGQQNEGLKSQSNLQKAIDSLGVSQKLTNDKLFLSSSKNKLKKITQSDNSQIQQQLSDHIIQNKLSSQHKIQTSILEDKKIQIESSILSANKAQIMEQKRQKQPNNFYNKFSQFSIENDSKNMTIKDFNKSNVSNLSIILSPKKVQQSTNFISRQNSPKMYNTTKEMLYETNIKKIKEKLEMQYLELISCDAFLIDDDDEEEQAANQVNQQDWKFKKLQFPKEEYYQTKFDKMSYNIINNRENNQAFQSKLFQILQNKDQIVVHTSQNKELMHISERKDIVSLAQWYEDMLNQIYNESNQSKQLQNQQHDVTYSKIFGDLQAVHQACISEIIRQISIHSVERGQLLKKVQENLMFLMKEAFSRQYEEKIQFQKDIHKEIQSIHRDCINKIDYYIPLISKLTEELEKKDVLNKRIVLEFRYLKKKNHKLEKFLKENTKEYKTLQQDYGKLKKQLEDLQVFQEQMSTKQQEEQQKMQEHFVKQLEQVVIQTQQQQEQQILKIKKENQQLKDLQNKFEQDQKEINQKYKINQTDIDDFEEQAQKGEFVSVEMIQNNQERPQISLYQIESTERQIVEMEGLDGIKFVLASVGIQVGQDLIQRNDQETETRGYFTTSEIETQTDAPQQKVCLSQHSQTPLEWMKKTNDSLQDSDSKNQKKNQNLTVKKEDSLFLKKIQTQIASNDKSQLKIDFNDRIDSPVHKYMNRTLSANRFTMFIEAISDDRTEVKSSSTDRNDQEMFSSIHRDYYSEEQKELIDEQSIYPKPINYKQTLENTLKANIEEDISDLHLILNSKQRFVLEVFQKIIDHNLLKESEYLNIQDLKLFIQDSNAFKYEENLRFRNIWNKCKLQLIDYVKSKIHLAEKEVEIEEANKNIDFGNNLYEKLIVEYENVLEQISSNSKKISNPKRNSISMQHPISGPSSQNSIILETEDHEEDQNNTAQAKKNRSKESNNIQITVKKPQKEEHSPQTKQNNNQIRTNKNKQIISPKNKRSSLSFPAKQISSSLTRKSVESKFDQINQNQQNTLVDDSISFEADLETERPESQKKKSQKTFSKIVNFVINKNKKQSGTQQKSTQQKNVDVPETISDDIIHKQIVQPKSSLIDLIKNYRFKKHQLRKKYGLQSSPNQDAAFNFLQTTGYKIMSTISKKNKGPIFTEQNTRKYISQIYNDKIKQIKSKDKSNPLHNVAYDFFLNKFGFKKMAEKNLVQFLRSLQYHNTVERVKMFLRFFGIDHEINYDIDDFNFYINCIILLDENLPQIYQSLSIYSIPKVIEILFKQFENKVTIKMLNKIKQDIEQLKYLTNEQSIKNKNVIDQDQALNCLLQAKIEEKKVNIIALRPIYLAGDVDNDQVIGYDEFVMLTRHIQGGMDKLTIMQLFFSNTDLIDDITQEKTMSFQQFAQISVENNMFNFEKQQAYLRHVEEWDQIKNINILKKYWQQKKDVLRLRFVKAQQYKNFYRLMIQKIDDYFSVQSISQLEQKYYQSISSLTKIQNSQPSLMEIDELNQSPLQKQQKSHHNLSIPTQVLQQMDQEQQEKQNISWLLYKLLDDESKRVVVDLQIEQLIPSEFTCVADVIEQLASDNMFLTLHVGNKEPTQQVRS
ncbi:hypothetical protein ABPG72_006316 [Tetrahymena utriculariae]